MVQYYSNSEYKKIKTALLSLPHKYVHNINNPDEVLHIRKIDYNIILREYHQIIESYRKCNIHILYIDPKGTITDDTRYLFNLMFARDLFFMTPKGAIVSKMFSDIRRKETFVAENTFRKHVISIKYVVQGNATFEGADALWVNDKLVVVGVGGRTNTEGYRQVKDALTEDGIECVSVPAPEGVLHLLGALQFVDSDLAVVRTELVDEEIVRFLRHEKIKYISIPESAETKWKYSMNFVTIEPRKIIIPGGCHQTKKIYEKSGIKIEGEIGINQLSNAGGGLACATGILARCL